MNTSLLALTATAIAVVVSATASLADKPTLQSTDDQQQIADAISESLSDAERVRDGKINVKASDGVVTLAGTVRCLQDRQLASQIAKRFRGVQSVSNQIVIPRSDRSDQQIRDDVTKVLRINDSIARSRIAVDVSAGEVSLTGQVPSLAEKRIAGFSASGVRGVTNVNNQMTVSLESERPDDELRDEVNALIVQSVYLDDVEVSVKVKDQAVTLNGSVPTAESKDALQRTAEIAGVTEVNVDEVKVDPSSYDPNLRKRRYANVSDDTIVENVKRAIKNDPLARLTAENIDVAVRRRTVTLQGDVSSPRLRRRIALAAQGVIGVVKVNNNLEVVYPDEQPTDMQLIRDTQAAIAQSAYLNDRELRVHCREAHVSLFGLVDSEREKQIAAWLIEGVPGVVHVNNNLTVEQGESDKSDEEIRTALQKKLTFAFYDQADAIDVTVKNGVAILEGEVDTWRQWQVALDLAIEAGSHHPHNLINVRLHPPHGHSNTFAPR